MTLQPYDVKVFHGVYIESVAVRARSHEEAEREALLVLKLDTSKVTKMISAPVGARERAA